MSEKMHPSFVKFLDEAAPVASIIINRTAEWIPVRKYTISLLKELADEMDKVQQDVNISTATGASAGIAGGSLIIGGIVASSFTSGAASPLVIAGTALAVGGAVTGGGAQIAKQVIKEKTGDKAVADMKKDEDLYMEISALETKLDSMVFELKTKRDFRDADVDGLKAAAYAAAGLTAKGGIKLVARYSEAPAGMLASFVHFVIAGGETYAGLVRFGKVLKIAGGAVAAVCIVWDIVDLVKTSIDIHKGSKSPVGKNLRDQAELMEKQLEAMVEFMQSSSDLTAEAHQHMR